PTSGTATSPMPTAGTSRRTPASPEGLAASDAGRRGGAAGVEKGERKEHRWFVATMEDVYHRPDDRKRPPATPATRQGTFWPARASRCIPGRATFSHDHGADSNGEADALARARRRRRTPPRERADGREAAFQRRAEIHQGPREGAVRARRRG